MIIDKVNLVTLNFKSKEKEKQFRKVFAQKSLVALRVSFVLIIFLYSSYGYFDKIVSPENANVFLSIRFIIVIPVLAIVLILSYTKIFHKIWQELLSFSFLITALGIIYMISVIPNNMFYYAGLFLVLMAGFFFIRLRFFSASISSIIIIILYNFLLILNNNMQDIDYYLISNCFYGAAILIGMFGAYSYERLERNNYYQNELIKTQHNNIAVINEKLEQRVKERTIELFKAKEKAEKSESKYRLITENSTDVIWTMDLDLNYVYLSPSSMKITGYTLEERAELSNNNLFTDESLANAKKIINNWINKYKNEPKQAPPYTFELEGIGKRKSIFYVEVVGGFIIDKNQITGLQGSTRDISERKQLELDLLKAKEKAEESDQLKTEFIRNMSHEIRTPLNGILGFSSILNKNKLIDKRSQNHINIIQNNGEKLLRIIEDILEISQLGTKQVKILENRICLNDLLLDIFSIFDKKAKENKTPLYLKKGLSDKESIILTDKTKLFKIISNLLENALKFTIKGYIEFGYQLKTNTETVEVEIYVKDTGIGIKPESQKTIFERFSQEEKELSHNVGGIGLGLSISKENVELLGGRITLKSEKGKGATFFVTIPYKQTASNTETNNIGTYNKRIIKKQDMYTILIVEDEEINYLYIETLLEDIGLNFKIIRAIHGKEAVEICEENHEIDFVFMDIKMHIMTGFEATKLIKEFRPDLPIVAQTAYSSKKDREKAFASGCDDFISKPISEETLNIILNKYLITE